jgi:hypothetical protein
MSYPQYAQVADLTSEGRAVGTGNLALRARSFNVVWSDGTGELEVDSPSEYFLLLPDTAATLEWMGTRIAAPGHGVVIMPPGPSNARLVSAGICARIFAPTPSLLDDVPIFGDAGEAPPLRAVKAYSRRIPLAAPAIYRLDELPKSPGMPRAQLFQSATVSINWVEYEGPRDRSNLSPHAHTDIEHGSLALDGEFVHHFRSTWGKNADTWREDEHLRAGPGSLTLIPPPIIHTSEGVGDGRHILIDIFSPPRDDFIANGQILNSFEYRGGT